MSKIDILYSLSKDDLMSGVLTQIGKLIRVESIEEHDLKISSRVLIGMRDVGFDLGQEFIFFLLPDEEMLKQNDKYLSKEICNVFEWIYVKRIMTKEVEQGSGTAPPIIITREKFTPSSALVTSLSKARIRNIRFLSLPEIAEIIEKKIPAFDWDKVIRHMLCIDCLYKYWLMNNHTWPKKRI